MILLDIDIIAHGNEVGSRLGNPQPLKTPGGGGQGAAPAADPPKPLTNNTSGKKPTDLHF